MHKDVQVVRAIAGDAFWRPARAKPNLAARARRLLLHILGEVVKTALPAALVSLLINVFVVQAMTVQGPSMQPNLVGDQRDGG